MDLRIAWTFNLQGISVYGNQKVSNQLGGWLFTCNEWTTFQTCWRCFGNSLYVCLNKRKRKGLRYIINMHHLNFEYLHMLVYMYVHISNIIFSIYIYIYLSSISLPSIYLNLYLPLSSYSVCPSSTISSFFACVLEIREIF